jgi:hypothetical protein
MTPAAIAVGVHGPNPPQAGFFVPRAMKEEAHD